ncbi:unnamed protein product [Phytophthora lilii]|uniref:Unnamed protein product n=1 Tax=Phytophthora lilii TaxID=2077276 RepID=A0A9W7CTL6_9STRA|nr:unnamed protein product [Phytophthora lilii]
MRKQQTRASGVDGRVPTPKQGPPCIVRELKTIGVACNCSAYVSKHDGQNSKSENKRNTYLLEMKMHYEVDPKSSTELGHPVLFHRHAVAALVGDDDVGGLDRPGGRTTPSPSHSEQLRSSTIELYTTFSIRWPKHREHSWIEERRGGARRLLCCCCCAHLSRMPLASSSSRLEYPSQFMLAFALGVELHDMACSAAQRDWDSRMSPAPPPWRRCREETPWTVGGGAYPTASSQECRRLQRNAHGLHPVA